MRRHLERSRQHNVSVDCIADKNLALVVSLEVELISWQEVGWDAPKSPSIHCHQNSDLTNTLETTPSAIE